MLNSTSTSANVQTKRCRSSLFCLQAPGTAVRNYCLGSTPMEPMDCEAAGGPDGFPLLLQSSQRFSTLSQPGWELTPQNASQSSLTTVPRRQTPQYLQTWDSRPKHPALRNLVLKAAGLAMRTSSSPLGSSPLPRSRKQTRSLLPFEDPNQIRAKTQLFQAPFFRLHLSTG